MGEIGDRLLELVVSLLKPMTFRPEKPKLNVDLRRQLQKLRVSGGDVDQGIGVR